MTDEDGWHSTASGHEILRCRKGAAIRSYTLRSVPGGVELWRTTEVDGEEPKAIQESVFTSSGEVTAFLDEVRRALIAGGWKEADD